MNKLPLNKTKLESLIREIETDVEKLKLFQKYGLEEFSNHQLFPEAAENLIRKSLQAVFDICNHILSRLLISAGKRPTTYKEIALAMGEYGLMNKNFTKNRLLAMAGYRNRMVHFYQQVTVKEIYSIIQNDLLDYERFLASIYKLLQNPQKYDLEIE